MNIRLGLAAFTLALGSLASVPAFAQSVPCAPGTQPAVGQAVYAQPVYAQPAPVYAQPTTVYAQPTYAQPTTVYAQPVAYPQPAVYGQQRGNRYGVAVFVNNLRARLNQADARLRAEVASGRVSPQAMQAFNAERGQVEVVLARASSDGFLAAPEQMRLDRMADRMEMIDQQYRVVAPNRPQGWGVQGRVGLGTQARAGWGRGQR